MRAHRTPSLLVVVVLTAIVVAGCDAGMAPSAASGAPATRATGATAGPGTGAVATAELASPQPTPVSVVAPDVMEANTTSWPVKSVTSGVASTVCAIRTDDRLLCWGGQADLEPPDDRYLAVSPGGEDACAIRIDGSLTCWGPLASKPPKGKFQALAGSEQERCAIRDDGRLACWSADTSVEGDEGLAVKDIPDGAFTQLVMSAYGRSCALRDDGTIVCWEAGETSSPAPDGGFVSLANGCAVRDTGELDCFGYVDGPAPTLPDGLFAAVSGSPNRGCALRVTGELACWGQEDLDTELPMRTPPGTYTAVSVGEYQACAVRTDRRAVCWGSDDENVRPSPSVRLTVPPLVRTTRIDASWRGIPFASPIRSYDVEYSLREPQTPGAGSEEEPVEPPWVPWLAGTTETSGRLQAEHGGLYCFRARAHDEEGLVGSWDTGGCTPVPVDDRELVASAEWTPVEGDDYFLHTALRTTTKGATIRIANGGAGSIGILGTRCGGCGTLVIRSPGRECEPEEPGAPSPTSCPLGEDEVDLRGPAKNSMLVVGTNNGEEGFAGPIDIVVTSSGKLVIIDAVIFDLETE